MATTPDFAVGHYEARADLAKAAADVAAEAWRDVNVARIADSWAAALPELTAIVSGAQLAAAQMAEAYVAEAAAYSGATALAEGALNAAALAGIASDGRELLSLLFQPAMAALTALQGGVGTRQAMATGLAALDMITRTQVADAGRAADSVALIARPELDGYVRVAVGRTCSRCIVLAGRWYRWNAGFDRHPRCDCIHLPSRQVKAAGILQDPRRIFDSMSRDEQDKVFTRDGARAIRDGADVARVVNARRGAAGLTPAGPRLTEAEKREARRGLGRGRLQRTRVFGRDHFITSEAVTKRGTNRKVRLMPESIYEIAGDDREEALRLLRAHGYILYRAPRGARQIAPQGRPAAVTSAPRVPAVPKAAQPYHRSIEGIEDLAKTVNAVRRAGMRAERVKLTGGMSADVELLRLPDGRAVVHKRGHSWGGTPEEAKQERRDQADAEMLVPLVARALGAPVARAYRDRADSVWLEYIDNATFDGADELIRGRDGILIGLLDVLTASQDRNRGNLLVQNGRLRGIDHGFAWGAHLITEPVAIAGHRGRPAAWFADSDDLIDNPLTPGDIDILRNRLEALRPDFAHVGREEWLAYTLAMLERMRRHARGTEPLYG